MRNKLVAQEDFTHRTAPISRVGSGLKILSLSIEYPNPNEPGLGLFVRSRLQHIAALTKLKVLAPVGLLDYSNPGRKWLRAGSVPLRRLDENAEVLHPRWAYPPFGTPLNVLCLFLGIITQAKRLHGEFAFQVIDAHFGYPDGVAAALVAASLDIPFLVTLRGNEPMFAESPFRRWCLRWALSRASRTIAVSDRLRDFAISMGVDPARVRTIGNGVDTEMFFPRDKVSCRSLYGIAHDAKLIVSVGSLIKAKGHHRVIRAVDELSRQGIAAHLLIAGTATRGGSNFEHVLRELATELSLGSRVRFLGWVSPEKLPELLSAADVFCLASDSEGWPNVIHEALSCGTPVVSTRVGAVPDMLPSERYGFIVPVGDQPALVASLKNALRQQWDRKSVGAWGQSRSWRQVALEVLEEMEQVSKCAE